MPPICSSLAFVASRIVNPYWEKAIKFYAAHTGRISSLIEELEKRRKEFSGHGTNISNFLNELLPLAPATGRNAVAKISGFRDRMIAGTDKIAPD